MKKCLVPSVGAWSCLLAIVFLSIPRVSCGQQLQAIPAAAAVRPVVASDSAPVSSSYILGPNDQVLIEVFQEDDLRTNTVISQDGSINFPLIGSVKLSGLNQGQARDKVSDLLRRYLVSPRVSVSVLRFARKRITVLGQVTRPGSYDLPDQEKIDITEAIAMAGGYTDKAAGNRTVVKRKGSDGDHAYKVDVLRMAKSGGSERFVVQGGDTITVPESVF